MFSFYFLVVESIDRIKVVRGDPTDPHIQALDDSGLITDCTGPWGSLSLLTPKPHEEDRNDVKDFIWRLWGSYRPLNGITRSFEFPIPRCADSIKKLGDSCGILFIISLDARNGYHQIRVWKCDQEKLAFSLLMARGRHTKLCLLDRRMHQHFILQWCKFLVMTGLLCSTKQDIVLLVNMLLILLFVMTRFSSMTFYSILTTSQHFFTIFLVLLKFSQSSGYHLNYPSAIFLKSRVEFVGHDLTASGNCPAQSNFNLIQNWPLPTHGAVLFSFIGLCLFYSRYCPWFET